MGNIGSQSNHNNERILPELEPRINSYPTRQHLQPVNKLKQQHKVLPDRDAHQKLRPTNNGEILHSGGTLTGRQKIINEIRHQQQTEYSNRNNRHYKENDVMPHKSRIQGVQQRIIQNTSQKTFQDKMRSFASEPDLRCTSSENQEIKEKRYKKKYKAPPPPHNMNRQSPLQWEDNSSDECPVRKPRLYKTRAETKKNSSHVNKSTSVERSESPNHKRIVPDAPSLRSNRLSLPEMSLADNIDFQTELKEATKKLRHIQVDNENVTRTFGPAKSNKDKLKTLDHNLIKTENIKKAVLEKMEEEHKNMMHCIRGEPSGKESTSPETSPNLVAKDIKGRDQPKTFYYGMNEPMRNDTDYDNDVVEYFASNLQTTKMPISSESDISTDIDSDENNTTKSKIDLQLRPILPKKQLEIPRFSPAAAWRLLSNIETNYTNVSHAPSDDAPLFVEECIEKCARPPPPFLQLGPRSNNDKSGDSGISGDDAMPIVGYDESPESPALINPDNQTMLSYPAQSSEHADKKRERSSWTPQQDLGDDSSIEENIDVLGKPKPSHVGPHIFSLSLPRDNQLAAYMLEKSNVKSNGLDKFRRSLSGVLSTLSSRKDYAQANMIDEESINWYFSKSTPNSLSNGFHSIEMRKPLDNKSTRVMYLPETYNNNNIDDNFRHKAKNKLSSLSKSCEDITMDHKESLQDPVPQHYLQRDTRKSKKFTFQSTLRQLEKKCISEKLAREAERREQKRLREFEAMQKVEEEFQRKRAREKASIRQQLRLISMDDDAMWTSLPPNLDIKTEARAEPDGAFSSYSTSPLPLFKFDATFQVPDKKETRLLDDNNHKMKTPVTQELSEYRQAQREYKEYRGSAKYKNDTDKQKHTTIHPQITCNMPKVKEIKNKMGNYRKDFACGVKSTTSCGSTYSEESANASQAFHSKYGSITRF